MVSQGFNAGAKVVGLVMATLGQGKGQGKLQLFQLVILFREGDGRSRGRERFHGFTFFSFCHLVLPSGAIGMVPQG